MSGCGWEFWIDVGGTFTDCLGVAPDGVIHTHKLLSSGVIPGLAAGGTGANRLVDLSRCGEPEAFYQGYRIGLVDEQERASAGGWVAGFDSETGTFELEGEGLVGLRSGVRYELTSGEEAPVVGIRRLLGIGPDVPVGPARICLGTTRGTNALLERRGAPTALVTTAGFADVLRIGYQNRPRLFDLSIAMPAPLEEEVVEIEERIEADGSVLRAIDREEVRRVLAPVRGRGIDALAVCLLHAYRNPVHERIVAEVAGELGFAQVSISTEVSRSIGIVARGDTTVVDAYLTPVLTDYMASIRDSLPEARLLLMTSAGGLVEVGSFSGKDCLLSGPAGGVVGLARAAEEAGLEEVIGFDMGGTSTDVSRWGGHFEIRTENEKAGVRIASPMIDIETVAAGGGSILSFDGQRLRVGPESAGARPGPACYGRGGPLALTDANVFLGRILPMHFPFPLDLEAVRDRFEQMARRVQSEAGRTKSPVELAEGFLDIACQNMAAPIRKISIARGQDVRRHALVAFGGAGPGHACAVARELGMRRVLVHPHAGILSAYGIGTSDLKRHAERAVVEPYSPELLQRLEPTLVRMEGELREALLVDGVPPERIADARRFFELHYEGGGSPIPVEAGADGDHRAPFEARHEQLYGYVHPGRGVVVHGVRVERIGRTLKRVRPELPPARRSLEPLGTTPVVFDGRRQEAEFFRRTDLAPGHEITGPAILLDPFSTILVEPGWGAEVTSLGDVLLTDWVGRRETEDLTEAVDPIQLEIFHNHFASIAEEMGVTLRRSALSTNVRERLDFSCALFTPDGGLVVNAPHIPVHLGAMSETVRALVGEVASFTPGDVYLTNDPFGGGSHLPDLTVITPVFDRAGKDLLFFSASRAHHAEIGGIRPGSMPPESRSLAEEGVLIRNFLLVEGGLSRREALEELLTSGPFPSRSPEENLADIEAQVAAGQRGARGLLEMIDRYGCPVVLAYMGHIQEASAARTRAALGRLGEGCYEFADALDDGTPIRVRIEVTGREATVDFTGSGPVHPGNLNANRSIVTAAVLYTFRVLLDEDIPLNGGVLDPVRLIVPEGVLNPPAHDDPNDCAAVVGGNVETSQRIVDVLLGALGLAAASQGTMNNLLFGDDSFGYYETIAGGAGAGPGFDGASAVHTHMTNTRLTDVEILEARYPVRVRRFAIRTGSGGAGRHRGGDGILRELEFLAELDLSLLTQRRLRAPYGLAGGEPGAAGRNVLCRASGEEILLGPIESLRVHPGDRLRIHTPGGGGYGATEGADPSKP